jgi:hypothetical protein
MRVSADSEAGQISGEEFVTLGADRLGVVALTGI